MRLAPCIALIATLGILAGTGGCSDDPNTLKGTGAGGSWNAGGVDTPDPLPPADSTPSGSGGSQTGTSSSGGTAAPPPVASATTPEQICVDAINGYRKTLGLAPYARWTDGETCASSQATTDSQTSSAHGAFGKCREFAQNECPGWPGPSEKMIPGCLKMMWGEGPGGGHYENMRSARYTQVSCGFAVLPNGNVWSVQNFK